MNLTRGIQNLYSENYRTLFKEIKEDLNKWETSYGYDELWCLRHKWYLRKKCPHLLRKLPETNFSHYKWKTRCLPSHSCTLGEEPD